MNKLDCEFAAKALEARLSCDAQQLRELHTVSFVRLATIARKIRKAADGNPPYRPAMRAADELEAIAAGDPATLQPVEAGAGVAGFIIELRELAAENIVAVPKPRNRQERRGHAKILLPRRRKLVH